MNLPDLGEETSRQELLAQLSRRLGAEHYWEERAQTAEAMAERIIAEELKRRRWQEAALRTQPRGDAKKVALAARLRAETTMTVAWIAERLGMPVTPATYPVEPHDRELSYPSARRRRRSHNFICHPEVQAVI